MKFAKNEFKKVALVKRAAKINGRFLLAFFLMGGGKINLIGGVAMAYKYVGEFFLNGIKTKDEVFANDSIAAKKIIEAKYKGSKINWISVPKIEK